MELAGARPDLFERRVAGLVFMNTAAYELVPPPALAVVRAVGRLIVNQLDHDRDAHDPDAHDPDGRQGDADRPDLRPRARLAAADDLSWLVTRVAYGSRPSGRAVAQTRRYAAEVPQSVALMSWIDLFDHDAREILPNICTPVLVMVGSRDVLTPVHAARRIARLMPGARLEVLRGGGHQLMQEQPAEVAERLDRFISQLAQPEPAPPDETGQPVLVGSRRCT
jgi:pimeloyl-ACP methyl ester carboxylesterase